VLFTESKIKVFDNSGCKLVKCVKIPGSSKPRYGRFGDVILVSTRIVQFKHDVKEIRRIKKGMLLKAIVTRTKKPVFFKDGGFVRFHSNAVVLIRKAQPRTFGGPKLAGNRVKGPIIFHKKLKRRFPKLFSLSSSIIC